MTERPILFSGPMVRAILEGRKSQTRRVIKEQPPETHVICGLDDLFWLEGKDEPGPCPERACPYGQPGDRLWVKEKHGLRSDVDWREQPEKAKQYALYSETGDPGDELNWHSYGNWRSARFMPKCIARLWLEIVSVRVERLQAISGADALAEGWPRAQELFPTVNTADKALNWYRALWDSINAKRGFGWDVNPWVWIVTFRKLP